MTATLEFARLAAAAFEEYVDAHPLDNPRVEERTYRQAMLAAALAQAEATERLTQTLERLAAHGHAFEDARAAPPTAASAPAQPRSRNDG